MAWSLDRILMEGHRNLASDVHLVRGVAPALRINGDICLLQGEPLQESNLRLIVDELLNEKQRALFEEDWQLCFSRHWSGLGRFRACVYYHGGCPELSIRI